MIKILRTIYTFTSLFYYRLLLFKKSKLLIGNNTVLFARFLIKGKRNSIKIGRGCTMRKTNIQINGNNNVLIFGDNVKVYEELKILIEGNDCIFKIGNYSTIGASKIDFGEKGTKVLIGEDCMLSRDITISTSDFHSIVDISQNTRINPAKDVIIGNHVWIGNGVYINKGASINDNCIVAAKSVVPGKDFKKNIIIGGVPARLIKTGVNWDRKIL